MAFISKAPNLEIKLRRYIPNVYQQIRYKCGLKELLATLIPEETKKIKGFRDKHGKDKVSEATVNMMYGGMRGLKSMVWEISVLDPEEGIRFRGLSIPECRQVLPKAPNGEEPLPEGIFWLLLTGNVPSDSEVKALSKEWAERSTLPQYVKDFLKSIPKDVHPMSQFSAAITILNRSSLFVKAYESGVKKTEYWKHMYEDCMNLISQLPVIASLIYLNSYKGGKELKQIDQSKDWSYNFGNMMGYQDKPKFLELLRLYLTIHCDHEGGNVSAHTTHLVGSALSDAYLSLAAGMNGLAGPLHGLANQEVLVWLRKVQKEIGENPSESELKDFVTKTLKSGQVIPGYGHAVLRKTDPRYTCQREFALKHLPNDPLFQVVAKVFNVVPPILKGLGKVQNPWPNVDAHSGVLLQHYGMTEMSYYTVLFGVSRALGVLSQLIWSRAFNLPIERPKSHSSADLMRMFKYK